jgi:2-phospho-L-lactate transferase/gluconeogenesis factor (CofD/UPF0052 family)
VLREVFGGPAIGDARKVLGAVANADARYFFDDDNGRFNATATPDTVRALNDQFLDVIEKNGVATDRPATILNEVIDQLEELPSGDGKLKGHTYTNLVLNALRLRNEGKLNPAIAEMHKWVGAPSRVRILGVTEESHNVMMHDKGYDPALGREVSRVIVGEGAVDDYAPVNPSGVAVWLEAGPMAHNRIVTTAQGVEKRLAARAESRVPKAASDVVGAIAMSDVVLLGPGSRDTSIRPMLLPDGVADGLKVQRERGGLWIAVANLTEEKPGMSLEAHMRTVEQASGRPVTHLIHNTDTTGLPEGTVPIKYDPGSFDIGDAVAIGEALVDSHEVKVSANDPIAHLRSPGHHNVWQIAGAMKTKILAAA